MTNELSPETVRMKWNIWIIAKDWFAWVSRSVHSSRDRRKTIFAVSENDSNLSRALYAHINIIETRTVSDSNDWKEITEITKITEIVIGFAKCKKNWRKWERYKWKKKRKREHTNDWERYALYDINIHSTRRSAIAIIIFVFNKSTVLRRVYSTTRISSLHIKKKNHKKRWNKSTNDKRRNRCNTA